MNPSEKAMEEFALFWPEDLHMPPADILRDALAAAYGVPRPAALRALAEYDAARANVYRGQRARHWLALWRESNKRFGEQK